MNIAVNDSASLSVQVDEAWLEAVAGGGPDGGAPTGTTTTTTTKSTTVISASGSLSGNIGPVKAGGQGSYTQTTEVNSTSSTACTCPVSDWKGIPYR